MSNYNEALQGNNDALRGILEDVNDLPDYSLESRLSLGYYDDGLLYVFVDGRPAGVGVEISGGGIDGYITEDKQIIFNNLPDGEYTLAYIAKDGSIVPIGALEKDTNVYYTITNTLTHCTSNNSAAQAVGGESYTATITAASGYELSSVKVTMGGADISSTAASGGKITIANVTGDIVIAAVAVEATVEPAYKNLLPLAVNADGTPYEGGKGYKSGYKMSTSSGSESATTGAYCSGFMPITDIYSFIHVKNITLSDAANVNNFVFYDANKTKLTGSTANGTAGAFHVNVTDGGNGVYKIRPSSFVSGSIAFFRFSCGGITDDTIVTVDQEIV